MDTSKRRHAPWSLYGLLILGCFSNVCFGEEPGTVKSYAEKTVGDLSCYVCNSVVEKCDEVDEHMKVKCKDAYVEKVYGKGSGEEPLKEWPLSFSELAAKDGASDSIGWNYTGFPSSYDKGKGLLELSNDKTHRFSGFELAFNDKKNNAFKLEEGFKSCRVMRISVESQKNGDKQVEISKTTPRVIRTCSFVNSEEKKGKNLFDDKGCRLFNYKSASVEVCYCKDDNCNASPYLHGSYWMIAASVLVLLAQMF